MKFLLELESVIFWLLLCIFLFNTTDTAGKVFTIIIYIAMIIGAIYIIRRNNKKNKQGNNEKE